MQSSILLDFSLVLYHKTRPFYIEFKSLILVKAHWGSNRSPTSINQPIFKIAGKTGYYE